MALIRCPECDTGHELDDALLAGAPRRVRCAQCRAVWVAVPEAAEPENDPLPVEPQSQDEIDSLFDTPLSAPASAAAPQAGQADVDALFAAPSAPEEDNSAARGLNDPDPVIEVTPARASRRLAEPEPVEEPAPRPRGTRPRTPPPKPASAHPSFFTVVAAGLVGTCLSLLAFRPEIIAIAPWAASGYTMIGLGARDSGLLFEDVRSRIVKDDGRETLEVSGTIINSATSRQIVPMLRLSVRSETGAELFVWTATADQADLAAKSRIKFRRRLASPPAGSHAVEVRFVPPEDVVASIR